MKLTLVLSLLTASGLAAGALQTAAQHPMQYYVSLPNGWAADRKWPVVVVIESANKEFEATLKLFEAARRNRPFILVAPLAVTNGGPNYRQADTYHYTEPVWRRIEADTCRFDLEGITAVAAEVAARYNGDSRFFLTGWEAGGHTVWPFLFQRPEQLRAAAPVATNYAGRCRGAGFSQSTARTGLPVTVFQVSEGRGEAPGKYVYDQSQRAQQEARSHGFGQVSEREVNAKHGPLPEQVLNYFEKILNRNR